MFSGSEWCHRRHGHISLCWSIPSSEQDVYQNEGACCHHWVVGLIAWSLVFFLAEDPAAEAIASDKSEVDARSIDVGNIVRWIKRNLLHLVQETLCSNCLIVFSWKILSIICQATDTRRSFFIVPR